LRETPELPPGFPPGMTYSDFMKLPPEEQMSLHQEMMKRKESSPGDDEADSITKKVVKNHQFNGLLEWILEREGHDFLIDVDREYIRDAFNHTGLMDKFMSDLNLSEENMSKTQFKLYLKHLYKSSAPTQENLEDEKYL
jgi:hypothetical protein